MFVRVKTSLVECVFMHKHGLEPNRRLLFLFPQCSHAWAHKEMDARTHESGIKMDAAAKKKEKEENQTQTGVHVLTNTHTHCGLIKILWLVQQQCEVRLVQVASTDNTEESGYCLILILLKEHREKYEEQAMMCWSINENISPAPKIYFCNRHHIYCLLLKMDNIMQQIKANNHTEQFSVFCYNKSSSHFSASVRVEFILSCSARSKHFKVILKWFFIKARTVNVNLDQAGLRYNNLFSIWPQVKTFFSSTFWFNVTTSNINSLHLYCFFKYFPY